MPQGADVLVQDSDLRDGGAARLLGVYRPESERTRKLREMEEAVEKAVREAKLDGEYV